MTPYYDQDGITIYNADCLDALRRSVAALGKYVRRHRERLDGAVIMRILYGWHGWTPRYEHTRERISTSFYHRRFYLWFVSIQWSHNGAPAISFDEMLSRALGKLDDLDP